MARIKRSKSGKSWLVVHQNNGTTISRHKKRSSAVKKRNKLHAELRRSKRRCRRKKRGGF